MGGKSGLRKDTDYETEFRCAGDLGILLEEVWVDKEEQVVRYNLAFLLPHCSGADNGRILGYDNAQGFHERHLMGEASQVEFENYVTTARRFYREAEAIRRRYENKSIRRRI